jgi:hypothetical protein
MEEKEIVGVVSREKDQYLLTAKDGTIYKIYAINPWESVPLDFYTQKFAEYLDKKVKISGRFRGKEIWNAFIRSLDEKDTIAPRIDDLLQK